ncbi:hypothetical protein C6N75_21355, partial [Streptomyces solincola]
MSVSDLLARRRADSPDRIAVVDAEGALDHAALGALVDRAARWLRDHGVGPEDRVLHAGGNDRLFVALFWATLRIGAVFVPVHQELTDAQIDHIVRDCTPAVAVCPAGGGAAARYTVPPDTARREIRRARPDGHTADVPADSPAALLYTSGTTGRPKGVICPHRQVRAAVDAIGAVLGYRADDTVLCRLPLSFDYGLYQVLLCTAAGAALVLASRAEDLRLPGLIERYGVTIVPLVPSLAKTLTLLQERRRPRCRAAPGTTRS